MLEQKKTRAQILISVVLAFATAWAFSWIFKIQGEEPVYTNSIISVFVFGAAFIVIRKAICTGFGGKWYCWFWPVLLGILFSFCMVAGAQLDMKESIPFTNLRLWLAILVLAIVTALLIRYSWDLLTLVGQKKQEKSDVAVMREKRSGFRHFFLTAGVIFICYFPVFLAVYPGFFVYDAQTELLQVITREFSTHHPLVHVLLLGGIIQLGYKVTGSYNVGIAMYTLFQMLVMSGVFAFCVQKLRSRGLRKSGQILLTLYFGICPVLVMFSLCSAKDGLFTGLLLILILLLQELCDSPDVFFEKKSSVLLLVLSAAGMMLLRHNGFYAFLVFMPFLLVFLKKYWKKMILCLLTIIIVYRATDSLLTTVLHADASENQEILTVPIMQMTRVYTYEKDNLAAEELELLYTYLPEDALDRYVPKVSDGVKWYFNNEKYAENSGDFWKLWLEWGIRYPFTYVNAWFMTSYGFWYPDTVIDVYRGNAVFTYTYEDSSYFGYEVEEPGTRESKIPWLDELYRKMSLEIFQQKLPVISMLFSPGFLFWVFAYLLGFMCYLKKYKKVIPFILPLLCWLTVILGPTYLVRYVVFLWTILPVLGWEVYKIIRQNDGPEVEEMKQL